MEREETDEEGSRMTLTETVHGIVCEVCNKRFSGNVPAQQHLQSEAHVRKVQQQARQSAHPLWCSVCSLQCNSQQQYDTHCDSPRHHHMVNQLVIIREQQALTASQRSPREREAGQETIDKNLSLNQCLEAGELWSAQNVPRTAVHLGVSSHSATSKAAAATTVMSVPAEIPPGGIRFNGSRGHCYVCNIELTSLQHKKQHVEGKQHKKRALTFGSGAGGGAGAGAGGLMVGGGEHQGVMMCSICQVPLSGQLNVEQHFNSPKHKARKLEHDRQAELSGAPPGFNAPPVLTGPGPAAAPASSALPELNSFSPLHGPNSIPGKLISFPGQANQHQGAWAPGYSQPMNVAQGNVPVTGVDDPQMPQSPESLKFEWHPMKGGSCAVCDQHFQQLEEGSRHLVSAEHRQREEDIKKQSCDICGVQYSGLASAKQHLNSEKHKKQFLYTRMGMPGNAPASGISGTEVGGGNLPNSSGYKNLLMSLTSSELSRTMFNIHEWEETCRKVVFPGNSSVLSVPPMAPENVPSQTSLSQPVVHPQQAPTSAEEKVLQPSLTSSQLSHTMSNVHKWEESFRKAVPPENFPVLNTPLVTPENVPPQTSLFQPVMHPQQAQTSTEEKVLNALDEDSRSPFPMTQVNIPPSVVGMEASAGQHSEALRTIPEYVFDGSRGICNVCKIDFTSKSHADSHLAGTKHQKARLRWQPHAMGLQAGASTQGQALSVAQGGSVAQGLPANTNQGTPAVPDPARVQQAYRFDGNRGFCFACKIDLSSEAHANQHLVGKKHQAAAERWTQEGEARNYPLYCDICHKPFTGQESAAQHFLSDKHKKKVALAEGTAAGRKDPTTGALLITRDGQMWYVCEVCKVPLNTPEQFKLHVNSPRHNSEVEKSKQQEHIDWSSPVDTPSMVQPSSPSAAQLSLPSTAQLSSPTAGTAGPDPTDFQHLTRFSTKPTPGAYVPPLQQMQLTAAGLTRTEHGAPMTLKTEPGVPMSYPQQLIPSGSIAKAQSGSSSTDITATGSSENGSAHGGRNPAYPGGNPAYPGRNPAYLGGNPAYPGGNPAHPGSAQVLPGRGVPSSSPDNHHVTSSTNSFDMGAMFSSISSLQGQRQSHSGPRFGEGAFSELSPGLAVRQVCRGSAGSRGSRSTTQVLRPDGNYDFDDDDDSRRLPTSSSSADYQDGDIEQSEETDLSRTMSTIHSGVGLSQTATEKRQAESIASTTSNNLTSLHTDPGSLTAPGGLRIGSEVMLNRRPMPPSEPNLFRGFRYACLLCKQPMNTKEDYEKHMKGLKHQMKAATVCAPDNSKEKLIKMDDHDTSFKEAYKCCKTTPRTYQVELMCKAMGSDSTVIYLPTGTGKTLAAMMTLSRMLTLNPTRPVLFLVDKVLLVLQQARYIITELGGDREFYRPHLTENGKMEQRMLKVAVLCGGLSVRDGTPLWKHDVIVTTAAFCQNLLQDEVLRWANFSLVVLDEAHHCTKNHPYNKLLSEHHLSLPPERRPKILGLTASPAGRRTKEETLHMLKDLLQNLGGATIATVDTKLAKEQLDSYSSSAQLVPVCVPMTEAEMGFHEKLLSYFIHAYVELMRCSNLQQICGHWLQELMAIKPPNTEDIKKFAQHLMSEPDELSEMVQLAQTARIKANTVPLNKFENIRMHVMTVGMTLLNSEDGIDFVLDDLERLFNPNFNMCLEELTEMGLPCREIATYVNTLCDSAKLRTQEGLEREEGAPSSMSIFQELLGTLANPQYMSWGSTDSMALVLVRERKVAHKFKDHLKRTSFVREHGMRVAVVVGHGAGSGEGEGMNLRKQDKVLQGIKSHRYNIVVATSVAEEGVDIPECQLVVSLNPPTTVKALVQMRGRARKKDSYFVVLCSSLREKEKLEDLKQQEQNMKWAAAQLTQQNATEQ